MRWWTLAATGLLAVVACDDPAPPPSDPAAPPASSPTPAPTSVRRDAPTLATFGARRCTVGDAHALRVADPMTLEAVRAGDGALVAWHRRAGGLDVARIDADGVPGEPRRLVDVPLAFYDGHALQLAAVDGGTLLVAVHRDERRRFQRVAMVLDDDGAPLGEPRVDSPSLSSEVGMVAVPVEGGALVATGSPREGTLERWGVDGSTITVTETAPLPPGVPLALAIDGERRAVAVRQRDLVRIQIDGGDVQEATIPGRLESAALRFEGGAELRWRTEAGALRRARVRDGEAELLPASWPSERIPPDQALHLEMVRRGRGYEIARLHPETFANLARGVEVRRVREVFEEPWGETRPSVLWLGDRALVVQYQRGLRDSGIHARVVRCASEQRVDEGRDVAEPAGEDEQDPGEQQDDE